MRDALQRLVGQVIGVYRLEVILVAAKMLSLFGRPN